MALAQERVKAERSRQNMTLCAPIDGKVQQPALQTVGGVGQPAEPLMILVPDEGRQEVEARLQNRDIGFVRVGQPAELKVETFAFNRR